MKTRIISGVLAVIIVILILILADTPVFPLAVGVVICGALFELFRIMDCLSCRVSIVAGFIYGMVTPFLEYYNNYAASVALRFLCFMAMFVELVVRHRRVRWQSILFIGAVTFLVTESLTCLCLLYHMGSYGLGYVILAIASACIADTGAYFTGSLLGRHKLCPEISPNKTVEGFFGGIVLDIVVMLLFGLIYGHIIGVTIHYPWLIFTAIVCAVISVLGDLTASVMKRQIGVKDFGNLIPGHGGIMDRMDSVLFTTPAFYVLVCMLPVFSETVG